MKRNPLILALVLLTSTIAMAQGTSIFTPPMPTRTECNEIIRTRLPDPCLLRQGNDFFLSGSNGRHGHFHIYHSTDMLHWRRIGSVFPWNGLPAWVDAEAPSAWGPTLRFNEKTRKYACFYSFKEKGAVEGRSRFALGVATADAIAGPWTEHGKLFTGGGLKGKEVGFGSVIDPVPFTDGDKTYVVFQEEFHGRWAAIGELSEDWTNLELDTLKAIYTPPGAWASWEMNIVEGFSMVKREGRYTLFYSGGGYEYGANYCVGALQADNIYGPWKTLGTNPLLESTPNVNAPGCMKCPIQMEDGSWWGIYHGYVNRRGRTWERSLFLDRIVWDDTGVPSFANLGSFKEDRPQLGVQNMLVFGDFECGDTIATPWDMSHGARLEASSTGAWGVSMPAASGARLSQELNQLPAGDYRLQAEVVSTETVTVTLGASDSGGRTIKETVREVNGVTSISLDFLKAEEMWHNVTVYLSVADTGNQAALVVEGIVLAPLLTRQLEAELGLHSGNVVAEWHAQAHGGDVVFPFKRMGQEAAMPVANAPKDGWYACKIRYGTAPGSSAASMNVYVNGRFQGAFEGRATGSYTTFADAEIPVYLLRGDNLIDLRYETTSSGDIGLDSVRLSPFSRPTDALSLPPRESYEAIDIFSSQYYNEAARNPWQIMGLSPAGDLFDLPKNPAGFHVAPNDPWCRGAVCWLCPGATNDIAVVWTAPKDGTIRISTYARKHSNEKGDGVRIRIVESGDPVASPSPWKLITRQEGLNPATLQSSCQVEKGDRVYVQLNRNGDNLDDLTVIDPVVYYL